MRTTSTFLAALLVITVIPSWEVSTMAATPSTNVLVWDSDSRESIAKAGERYVKYAFWFTNVSTADVLIESARSSCFCTTAELPKTPWRIQPGSNGPIHVTMDLAGKSGTVIKPVVVKTSVGSKTLMVKATVASAGQGTVGSDPAMNDAERLKNMQTALADRQAVFKKAECASCHAEPAKGKYDGAELYAAVCHSCHDSEHRASSVPDLRALKHPTNSEHWKNWIAHGRPGSMMPAFAKSEGGPLDARQISALAEHLAKTIPSVASPPVSTGFQVPPGPSSLKAPGR